MVWQFIAGLFGGSALGSLTKGIEIRLQRARNNIDPVDILSGASYADALRLDYITEAQYLRYMRELGYDTNSAKIFYANTKVFLTREDNAIRRIADSFTEVFTKAQEAGADKDFTPDLEDIRKEYCSRMYGIGYDESEANAMFEALRPVPTFSILLEWLAKEVFEPSVRATFQLDDDYPIIWDKLMQAIKVPEFERKAYWASHWNHPSPGQIGQMYTRFRSDRNNRSEADAKGAGSTVDNLSMDKSDFTEALKLHEIAPYWRDRIIANSFIPLNITTLQGGYVYGLKPDAWFKGRLEDYGFSSENAEFVLSIWRRKYPYASKAPRSQNILLRIQSGETHLNDGIAELKAAGIPDDASEFVAQVAYEKWILRREKSKIQAWKKVKRDGTKTDNEIFDMIKASGYNDNRANALWELVLDADAGYTQRLRYRDISRGFKDGNLTAEQARQAYEDLRVYDEDIDTLLTIYGGQAEKEAE